MIAPIVITPPPFEPITLAAVRLHLRVDPYPTSPPSHPDDDLILRCIVAARERCEEITRRALVHQGLRIQSAAFPCARETLRSSRWGGEAEYMRMPGRIELLRPPLIQVDSVQYYDGDNALQTVDPAQYFVVDTAVPCLQFGTSFSIPCVYARPDAVRVNYTAGYPVNGSPGADQADYIANIPQSLIQGMLLLIGDMYENREDTVVGTITSNTRAAEALFESKRVHSF